MLRNLTSRSGIFNPRILCAFALCSVGSLLAMFSFAATPSVQMMPRRTSLPSGSSNFLSTFGSNTNQLPPGVPLPASTQLGNSLTAQSDRLSAGVPARLPRLEEILFGLQMASPANSLGNSVLANQQSATPTRMLLLAKAFKVWGWQARRHAVSVTLPGSNPAVTFLIQRHSPSKRTAAVRV
jgi:hypothetical protein